MSEPIGIKGLSPLRYPGSKRKLVKYLWEIIEHNELNPNVLVEPFVGGASITLHFLLNGIVEKAIIADKDRLIYSFWHVLFSRPHYLTNFIRKVEIGLDTFYQYKEIAKASQDYNEEKLAEACIFLNRTSFSGIMTHEVGPLGGKNQESQYKIHCRFNRSRLIERVERVAQFGRKVLVLDSDWKDAMEYAKSWAQKRKRLNRLFFYLDPPFFNKADELYRCFFRKEDHRCMYEVLKDLDDAWVLSYDNAPEIRKMYSGDGRTAINIEMPYSTNSNAQRREKELVITPLALPTIGDSESPNGGPVDLERHR